MFKKNSIKKTKNSAFSLVELSIVLLVIGILIVGASQGYSLVKSARISNARSITAKSPISQTPGLLAWYETTSKESFDKSQIRDGAQITQWKDISPSSILTSSNILITTASDNVTYSQSSINKLPAVKFSASGKLSLATFTQGASSQATIFMVVKLNYVPDSSNYRTIFDSSSSIFAFSIKSDMAQLNAGSAGATNSSANSFSNSGEYAIAIYFNGSSSKVFLNNTNLTLPTSASDGSSLNAGTTNQLVGMTLANKVLNAGFSGFISEVAVFNRVVKSSERKEIFNYFSKKYKINITGV
jgi:prepilin-type N-terminal cleavage/methylation domain-containing protein